MSTVVSIINLKGGVGKTTLTVALAEFIAVNHPRKKVLVIDLDPQSNSSAVLIGEDKWSEHVKAGHTLFTLFKDQLEDTATFDLNATIVKKASNLGGGLTNLHVLPSSLEFIGIQDRIINISQTALIRPTDVLSSSLQVLLGGYDLVLIDCPPSLGLVTRNGLIMSDYFLIPVIPDRLSTWGIPEILSEMERFKRKTSAKLSPLGIVVSMYRSNVSRHSATVNELEANHRRKGWPRVFRSKIPLAAKVADSTDWEAQGVNTLKQKYGWAGTSSFESMTDVVEEFTSHVF
jgi:chromosome partitioning protein